MTLHIIAAGGTFEKHYDEITGTLVFGESHIPALLKRARITAPVAFETVSMLDSLDMKEADRRKLLDACRASDAEKILIVHGTDTMRETAEVLGQAGLGKTVVLTGAMVPYEFDNSDAFFNFGFAMAAAGTLPHSVYIAMNGRVFEWNRVRKNRKEGRFEEADERQ